MLLLGTFKLISAIKEEEEIRQNQKGVLIVIENSMRTTTVFRNGRIMKISFYSTLPIPQRISSISEGKGEGNLPVSPPLRDIHRCCQRDNATNVRFLDISWF